MNMIGKSFSNYSIVDKIGEGGMGEVYRAQDSKLKRNVAVKVLPSHLLEDPERLARFEREAQLLASLNHPNIASVYGLEESGGHRFLVMELVEGEDLAVALHRGPLSPEAVLPIATQVAEALEAAHESGIIHRDLKPANILLRADGQVKVLDFGLAKAIEGDPADSNPALTQSPTLTGMMTGANVILGTAAYMSPEQARGQRVDKRTDIWAYGVVLFELLTGTKTFDGDTISDVLASVLKSDPDLDTLPPNTPRHLRTLIERCLVKNPKRRLRDIGEARLLLEAGESGVDQPAAVAPAASRQGGVPRWLVGALLALAVATTGLGWFIKPAPPLETVQGSILIPEHQQLKLWSGGHLAFSPDGRRLAFVAEDTLGVSTLWVRNLADAESHQISGTKGAINPFWSPDGSQIGFFSDDAMKRVPVEGGAPITVCDAPDGRGGSWQEDGTIIFAPGSNSGLMKIGALGGTAESLTQPGQGDISHRWPQGVDGGLLFTNLGQNAIYYQPEGDSARALVESDSQPQFQDGLLYYMLNEVLFARPFNPGKGTFTGDPRTVAAEVFSSGGFARGAFTVTTGGRLAYVSTREDVDGNVLVRYTRQGDLLPTLSSVGLFSDPALSLDGERFAFSKFNPEVQENDIWVLEVQRGVQTRITAGGKADDPVWSPDGTQIAYADSSSIYVIPANGVGERKRITDAGAGDDCTHDWSRDGRYLLWSRTGPAIRGIELWIHDLETGEERRLVEDAFQGQFSPDGEWIVYTSRRSGANEIYLQDFPGLTGRWQISVRGGDSPRWANGGASLIHLAADRSVVETPIRFDDGVPRIGQPTTLFASQMGGDRSIQICVSQDASVIWSHENRNSVARSEPIRFVLNWQGK